MQDAGTLRPMRLLLLFPHFFLGPLQRCFQHSVPVSLVFSLEIRWMRAADVHVGNNRGIAPAHACLWYSPKRECFVLTNLSRNGTILKTRKSSVFVHHFYNPPGPF